MNYPSLRGNWPFLALIFLGVFVWVAYSELLSQDCLDQPCLNKTPVPHQEDTTTEMIDKLITTLRVGHSPVNWRQALMISLIMAFVIILFFNLNWTLRNYGIILLLIFVVVYAILAWSIWSYWRPINMKIEKSLIDLRSRLVYTNYHLPRA